MVDVLQDDPHHLHEGQDEGPEGQRPGVVTAQGLGGQRRPGPLGSQPLPSLPGLPQRADEGGAQGEGGDILGLVESPVEGGKGPGQDTLAQSQDPVEGPE